MRGRRWIIWNDACSGVHCAPKTAEGRRYRRPSLFSGSHDRCRGYAASTTAVGLRAPRRALSAAINPMTAMSVTRYSPGLY